MKFYHKLLQQTEMSRKYLLSSPVILRTMQSDISIEDYITFLTQAYHHVKHTVPLLMSVGAKLGDKQEWLREAVAEYIEEEIGHQEWILNDIYFCGGDIQAVRTGIPAAETELMIAYAYDMSNRVNPLGFFGMVLVLEGTSVRLATLAADLIQKKLELPDTAFSYLRSHGSLDQEHIKFFEALMNKITDLEDQHLIIHAANMFYRLYANIFRSLDQCQAAAA